MPNEQDKEAKRRILETFGLSEGECEIKNLKSLFGLNEAEEIEEIIGGDDIYIISPKQPYHEKLPIRQIGNLDIFNEYNIQFEHCVFKAELLIERKTIVKDIRFLECTFEKRVSFDGSTFQGKVSFDVNDNNINAPFKQSLFQSTLSCENSIFNAKVVFFKSEFNTHVYFQGAIFNEYARFEGVSFNGKAEFFKAKFKSGALFSEAHFQLTANFKAAHFYNQVWFKGATFHRETSFESSRFEKMTEFNNSIFSDKVSFQDIVFYGLTRFTGAIFHSWVGFGGSTFKERAFFSKAHFQGGASLSNVIFEHNAYFNEAEFLGEAKFKQSEFYMNAHFYGTIFKEIPQRDNITMNDIPNFLQIILNGYINLTNTKQLLFSFEQLKSIIDRDDKKEKDELANEFRNTFRNFKNGLIKDNNLIDASQFHKMELYAKELEMSYKQEKAAKDWAEKIQLMLYRLTSDHHTDLLLILNNVFIIIALFSAMNFAINYLDMYSLKIGQSAEAFIACLIFIMLVSLLILGLGHGKLHLSFRFSYIQTFFHEKQGAKKCLRACVVFVSHVTAIITLVVKPSSFVPIFGKLIDECFGINSPTITSLNIIYAIFMFLLIFSLQKTARKNTIVPN